MSACTRTPSVRVEARRLDGPRPPQVALRCRATGLPGPIKYAWRFAAGVKTLGWSVPTDEPVALVQLPDPVSTPVWAECAATGDNGVVARAAHALTPPVIAVASTKARAGEVVTARGSGFGPSRNDDDALWFVPSWGRARAADHACKGATWSDTSVSACLPPSLPPGRWQLRVQAGGELATAAAPVEVTR